MIYVFLYLLSINQFKYTSCTDIDYLLLKKENNLELISKEKKIYNFKNKNEYHLLDFYCVNNELFFLDIERKVLNNINPFRHINLYKLGNEISKIEWLPTPDEYFTINDNFKEFYSCDNKLFFYDYQNNEIYSYDYLNEFLQKILFRDYEEGQIRQLIYSNKKIALDFKKNNADKNHIYLISKDGEKIISDKILRDFYYKNKNYVFAYTDEDEKLYLNLNSNEIFSSLIIDNNTKIKIFFIDDIIYFFTKLDKFYLFVYFNDGNFVKKEIEEEVFDFYFKDNKIIYLKNDLIVKKINIVKDKLLEPQILNIKNENSKLKITISNFNLDYNFYKALELEISDDENFNNIIKNIQINEYSKNSENQVITLNNNNFEKDKKLYLRIRYLDIFNRNSNWNISNFIILNDIVYPEVNLLSPKNEEIIKDFSFFITWKQKIEFSYNIVIAKDKFFQNIVKEFYYLENDKQEIKYLEPGEYFLKIYYKDKFERKSKEKTIKFYVKDNNTSSGCSFQR